MITIPFMDTIAQSNTYLNELASNPIQYGSNLMRSVADSTEFGSALRQFELARMGSGPEVSVPTRICIDPRHFDIDPLSSKSLRINHRRGAVDFSISKRGTSISIQTATSSIEPVDDRFQTFESSFRAGDVSSHAILRLFRAGSISIRAGHEFLRTGSASNRRRENRWRGVRGSPVNRQQFNQTKFQERENNI